MADIDELKIKLNVENLEKFRDLIKELKDMGLKKKTLNLLVKDICRNGE